jgi:hypothetical protein
MTTNANSSTPSIAGISQTGRIVSSLGRSRLRSDRGEHGQLRGPERVATGERGSIAPSGRSEVAHSSVTLRPLTNSAAASTSATTASGTGSCGRHDHRRQAAAIGVVPVHLAADRGRGDVDAVAAEDRADVADHPGDVAVAEDRDVLLQLDHEAVVPHLGEMRHVARADSGPRHRDPFAAGDHGDADQLVEVLGLAARLLLDHDPALLREGRRVDVVDLLLGAPAHRARDHGERQQPRVEVRDAPEEGGLDPLDRAALREPHRELAEVLRERQERRQRLHRLGVRRRGC